MSLIIPKPLKKGDKIVIIAPAGLITPDLVKLAIDVFEDWGLEVKRGEHLFAQHFQFAGTDKQRLADLQNALDDPEIKAVICARGGYGCMRIADKINWQGFIKNPKWVCGFSDITVLHSAIHKLGICSAHTLMPLNMAKLQPEAPQIIKFKELLFQNKVSYKLDGHSFNRFGNYKGSLVGGNLSLLYALNGTLFDIDFQGKILFLEDVGEHYYHIDRMIQGLRLAGKFEKLGGLILGGFSEMTDNKRPFGKTPEEIIIDVVKNFNYPVAFGFPGGHIEENYPLPFGEEVVLQVSELGTKIEL